MFAVESNFVDENGERTMEEELEVLLQKTAMLRDRMDAQKRTKRVVFDGVEIPARPRKPAQPAAGPSVARPSEPEGGEQPAREEPPHMSERARTKQRIAEDEGPSREKDDRNLPVHPFAKARDATNSGDPIARDYA